jgi:hypothetical protein
MQRTEIKSGPGVRWAYATTMPGGSVWHVVGVTFDSLDEAADAAKRWMMMAAEHNHLVAVKLEKIDEIKAP